MRRVATSALLVMLVGCGGDGTPAPASGGAAAGGAADGGGGILFESARSPSGTDLFVMDIRDGTRTNLTRDGRGGEALAPGQGLAMSPDGRKVAFELGGDIWVMNADGSGRVNVTNQPGFESAPSFHPDGTRLAFSAISRDDDATSDIFVVNVDGTRLRKVVGTAESERSPVFSPDGERLAFVSAPLVYDPEKDEDRLVEGERDLYIVGVDGSGRTRLTTLGRVTPGRPAFSPDGTRLAFSADRAANGPGSDLFMIDIDGSDLVQLTDDEAFDDTPVFSPDGRRLAFASTRDDVNGNSDLYIMELGGGTTHVSDGPASAGGPTFSPDGTQVAFTSTRGEFLYSVAIVNADGSGLRRLTDRGSDPVFLPDGRRILFASLVGEFGGGAYTMRPDGSEQRDLSETDGGDPVFSPDGRQVAFARGGEIYLMNPDGSGEVKLGKGENPVFSRDGRRILFETFSNETLWDVGVMDADGSGWRNLTGDRRGVQDSTPAISPDGSLVAFVSDRDGGGLYVVNADGTALRRLAAGSANAPAFSPDGRRIAFSSGSDLWLVDLRDGSVSRLTAGRAVDDWPVFTPDGERILFISSLDIASIAPDGSGRAQVTSVGRPFVLPPLVPSPDGRRVAFSAQWDEPEGEVYVIGLDGSGLRRLTHNPGRDQVADWR